MRQLKQEGIYTGVCSHTKLLEGQKVKGAVELLVLRPHHHSQDLEGLLGWGCYITYFSCPLNHLRLTPMKLMTKMLKPGVWLPQSFPSIVICSPASSDSLLPSRPRAGTTHWQNLNHTQNPSCKGVWNMLLGSEVWRWRRT